MVFSVAKLGGPLRTAAWALSGVFMALLAIATFVPAAPAAPVVAKLSSNLGMRVDGRLWRQHAGAFVAAAGDFNGDGLRDVLIGTSETHREGGGLPTPRYSVYVVFGHRGPRGRVLRLDRLGTFGLHIVRRGGGILSGAGAGDVNGDSLDDIVLGTPGTSSRAGETLAYVVYGRRGGGTLDLGDLGRGGFRVRSAEESGGSVVAGAGDLDRDGYADILIGEPGYGQGIGRIGTGRVVVVFGARRTSSVDTWRLGKRGMTILGPAPVTGPDGRLYGTGFATSLAGGGDTDGDRRRDVVIGAPWPSDGAAYVVTGARRRGTTIDLGTAGADRYVIRGQGGNHVGSSVASAGDQNADGLDDLVIGEFVGEALAASSGPSEAHIVYGQRNAGDVALAQLGSRGVVLRDTTDGDRAGASVAGIGDVTGDGRPDILVGAPLAAPAGVRGAGSAFLIPGGTRAHSLNLRTLTARGARRYDGRRQLDTAGSWVAGLGDVNGDHEADIAVAAPRTDYLSQQSGSVYIVYGSHS